MADDAFRKEIREIQRQCRKAEMKCAELLRDPAALLRMMMSSKLDGLGDVPSAASLKGSQKTFGLIADTLSRALVEPPSPLKATVEIMEEEA